MHIFKIPRYLVFLSVLVFCFFIIADKERTKERKTKKKFFFLFISFRVSLPKKALLSYTHVLEGNEQLHVNWQVPQDSCWEDESRFTIPRVSFHCRLTISRVFWRHLWEEDFLLPKHTAKKRQALRKSFLERLKVQYLVMEETLRVLAVSKPSS